MAEREDVRQIPLLLGMRQDIDSTNAPPGTILDARNVRFSSTGGAVPRLGAAAVPATTTTSAHQIASSTSTESAAAIFKVGQTGALAIGGKIFGRDPVAQVFNYQGTYSSAQPIRRRTGLSQLNRSYGYQAYGFAVSSDGHQCIAAPFVGSTNEVDVVISDINGERKLDMVIAGANRARVVACGVNFVVLTQDNATGNINATPIAYASGIWTVGATVLQGTLFAGGHWDACEESASKFWIVFQDAAATLKVDERNYPALTSAQATHENGLAGNPWCSIFSDHTTLWVGYTDNPAVTGAVNFDTWLVSNLGHILGPYNIASSTKYGPPLIGPDPLPGVTTAGRRAMCIYGDVDPAGERVHHTHALVIDNVTSTLGASVVDIPHVLPVTKPGAGGRFWLRTSCGTVQVNPLTVGWSTERCLMMRFIPDYTGSTGAFSTDGRTLELVTDETDGMNTSSFDVFSPIGTYSTSTFAALPQGIQRDANGSITARLMIHQYSVSSAEARRSVAEIGPSAVLSGQPVQVFAAAATTIYTGGAQTDSAASGGAPVGFVHTPVILLATPGAAGALTVSSKYRFRCVFEWTDVYGNRHRSAPSPPVEVSLGVGQNSVTLKISTLGPDPRVYIQNQFNRVVVHVYRTVANGDQYYRDSGISTVQLGDSTTGEATYVSVLADGSITGGEFIYTDGGFFQFDIAPSCRYVRRAEDSLWCGGLWDRRLIQRSRVFVPDEPVEFSANAAWQIYLPQECTALAYQDGITYAFCERAIYTITGDGPNEQGQGQFSPPRALTTEFGVTDDASVLETTAGIIFYSQRGFMMIARGGGMPQFIGAPVQRSFSPLLVTCLGSVVSNNGESRLARWLMTAGGNAIAAVLDLDTMSWSYDTYAKSFTCAGVWPEGVAYCRGDLTAGDAPAYALALETGNEVLDPTGVSITSQVQFHDIRLWGMAGWGRCQTVGCTMSSTSNDASTSALTFMVQTDGATESRPWNVSAVNSQYRALDLSVQECTAIGVTWSLVRTVSRGPSLNGLFVKYYTEGSARLLQQSER